MIHIYKGQAQNMRFIKSVLQNGLKVACEHLVVDEHQYCGTCEYRTTCNEVRKAISYIEKRYE